MAIWIGHSGQRLVTNTKSLTVDHKLNGNVCGELHPTCTLHTSSVD
jgi:hypothetical protein